MKYFVFVTIISSFASCNRNRDTHTLNKSDSLQFTQLSNQNLNGTYEYSEPVEEAYLYFKIEMRQHGDSVNGQLSGGIYLAKSNAGGFTNPTVLANVSLKGIIKDNAIDMQLTLKNTERMEEEAPDLLGMMNFPDLDTATTATIWAFSSEQGALVSQNGLLMPDGTSQVKFVWEKIK